MPITRTAIPKQLEEGLNAVFGMTYSELADEWSQVFDTESSNKAFEEDVLMTGFGLAVETDEGQGVTYDTALEGWTKRYLHEKIALAFSITEEAREDNLYKRNAPKNAKALARSLKHTKETKAAAIFNNGFSASYPGGDAVAMLSASHPTRAAGNQSNILGTPADFAEASLEDMLIQIRTAKDDRGLYIALKPKKLIHPPDLMFDVHRVLASMGRTATADNDINAVNSMGILSPENVVNMTRLTDTDAWFIKTDCPEGLKHMQRRGVRTNMDEDFNTGNWRYKASERYSLGWTNWRSIYGTAGAAA